LQATTNAKYSLENRYNQFLQEVSDTDFSFETNTELLAIGNFINTTIVPSLQSLAVPSLSPEMFEETMTAHQEINKNINTASNMLNKFINYYPSKLFNAKVLVAKWLKIKHNLDQLNADMETLSKSSSALTGLGNWLDRSREPLTLLQAKIASAQKYFDTAKTAFAKTFILTDSNKIPELTSQLCEVERHLEFFHVHYKQADSEWKVQKQLLANSDLRRQNSFLLFEGATASSTVEHKSRRPR
jgi:hypothetical protein